MAVTTAGKEKLVFAIMLNNYRDENEGRAAIDIMTLQLAEFNGQSGTNKTRE